MRVLLFDAHCGGHHLECASRLQSYVREVAPSVTVDFLAPSPREAYDHYFAPSDIDFLFDPSYDTEQKISDEPRRTREDLVDRTIAYAQAEEYDIVYFLQLDDLVREVHRSVSERNPDMQIAGLIVGSYFMAGPVINRVVSRLLRSNYGDRIAPLLPEVINHVGRYRNDQYMYRAMRDQTVDQLFVFSERARTYLSELYAAYPQERATVVPDPTELYFTMDVTAAEARSQLDLPSDAVIALFFGQMRDEKGIETLLSALKRYDGDPFTMVLAGSPTDVTDETLAAVQAQSAADLHVVAEFIPDEELPLYFLAADGVVCPYQRSFGEYRTSNVFQKAAGAGRPILASDFGTFRDRIDKWDLGTTFEPESPGALATALREFVSAEGEIGDPDRIREYAQTQTYRVWAETTVEELQRLS